MPKQSLPVAKLSRPRIHQAVPRHRLFERLDAARATRPCIFVVGPPGAGKTTLVASWLDVRRLRGIWYQIDSGDQDLASFFHYLGQAVGPSARNGARLPALTPEYLATVPAFARRFFRELFQCLPRPATLVLDNYQEVPADHALHELVANAAEEAPQDVSLVLISRRDPPGTYARLQAHEHVQVLDWDDLRLTRDEALAIGARRRDRSGPSLDALYHACQGWAAGLVLMLESAKGASEPGNAFSHSREALFRYFAQIVFSSAGEDVRHVLLTTGILPRTTAAAARALSGNEDAGAILEQLYRSRLFTHRHPSDPPTYEYHALFRQFLRDKAAECLDAAVRARLSTHAGKLLEQADDCEAAVPLYLEGEAHEDAARVLIRVAPALLARGRWKTLQEWGFRLPQQVVLRSPWLLYWIGRSRLGIDTPGGRELLNQALRAFTKEGEAAGEIQALCGIMESHWLEWSGYRALDPLIDRVLELLDRAPTFQSEEMELRAQTLLLVAMSFRKPRSRRMDDVLGRVMALLQAPLDDEVRLLAAAIVVGHTLPALDLPLARRAVELIGTVPEHGHVSVLARINWFIRLAYHCSQCGEHERAAACLARAQELADAESLTVGIVNRTWWGVFVHFTAGNLPAALKWIQRLETEVQLIYPFQRAVLLNVRSVVSLAQGDAAQAAELGRAAVSTAREDGPAWSIPYFTIPTIYALIETGQQDEAQAHMRALHEFLAHTFIAAHDVEVDLAAAYCELKGSGRSAAFLQSLAAAMARARRERYLFGWRGQFAAHRVLMAEALRAGIERTYLAEVIARFRIAPGAEADQHWPWPLRIHTLGRFEVFIHGERLVFGRKMPRRLLAALKALIALGGKDVAEEKLAELLWEGGEGDDARHALTVTLHRLRKLVQDPGLIQVQDARVTLDPARVWVDALAFEQQLKDHKATLRDLDSASADLAAQAVSDLYQGAFLPSDTGIPWTISLRERLRAGFVDFVGWHGTRLEASGRWEDAAQWYRRGLSADDLSESFYQGQMRCCLHTGRHAEGLVIYRRMRELLSVTLGMAPSRESEALYRAIQSRYRPPDVRPYQSRNP